MRWPLILLVRVYQWTVAPALPPTCRFLPSCSHYMVQALEAHGAARGLWLGLRRLLRCHPFCRGGYDPVPEPAPSRSLRRPGAGSGNRVGLGKDRGDRQRGRGWGAPNPTGKERVSGTGRADG